MTFREIDKPQDLVLAEMAPVVPLQLKLVTPELLDLLLDVAGSRPQLHEGLEGGLDAEDALQVAGVRQEPQGGHHCPLEVREAGRCPCQLHPQLLVVTRN